MQRKSPFADSPDVVVNGLDQPLLDADGAEVASASDTAAEPVIKPLSSLRSVTRIRSQPGRISSYRSAGNLGVGLGDDVAFKITVRQQSVAFDENSEADGGLHDHVDIDVCHDTVSDAIQGAVENAVQGVVQDAVQGAVQDAVQQVMDDTRVKFDVRANFYTLIAITGVVIFWRGVWTTWDYFFGFAIWSELGAVATGLAIMITFRLMHVPLLDGLPSG